MSDTNQAPELTLPEKVIQHVTVTSAALEKAAAAEVARSEKQAQVDQMIPEVCKVMVEHERIMPTQREKLAAMCQDPVKVLELLMKVAGHRNPEELSRLGSGVDPNAQTKTAGANQPQYNSLTDPNVGARTTRVKQSSSKLFSGLGLAQPAE